MTKERAQCFKGIFAVMVVLHHVLQDVFLQKLNLTDGWLSTLAYDGIQACGFLPVAFFFFLSGLGLKRSYDAKGKEYGHALLGKRIVPIYGIVFVMALLYLVELVLIGADVSLSSFFKTFGFGATIIGKGWFLQAILLFYAFFWVLSYLPTRLFAKYGGLVIVFLYIISCRTLELPSYWYQGASAFAIGFYWQSIDFAWKRFWWVGWAVFYVRYYQRLRSSVAKKCM